MSGHTPWSEIRRTFDAAGEQLIADYRRAAIAEAAEWRLATRAGLIVDDDA